MTSEELIKKMNKVNKDMDVLFDQLDANIKETNRVYNVAVNTRSILDDLDEQFSKKTGLTCMDIQFLFIAIGLQILRQYLLTNDKFRITANQGDKLMQDVLSLSPPSWQEVLTQSVPYDAIQTGVHVDDTGLSGVTHRYRTLGHDPLLGWVFGTANIMTNSLTKTTLETYQVKNMQIVRHYPLGVNGMLKRAVEYGINDPTLFATAVARQAIHFGSDYFTKQGLPIPVVAMVSDDLAKNMLTKWHIDTYSVTRGAMMSTFINQLIFIIHGLFFDGKTEKERMLYEVRTRKILSYSNMVATSSNIAVIAVTRDLNKLDVGGAAVTIYRLITDRYFIKKVKEEFIFGSYRDMIRGNNDLSVGLV